MTGAAIQRLGILCILFGGVQMITAAVEGNRYTVGALLTVGGFAVGVFGVAIELTPEGWFWEKLNNPP